MGLSAKLFYEDSDEETLFSRISLTKEQIKDARERKDKLLELIKSELSSSLGFPVKHWLQGSYKNHTLTRPVRKGDEFDIDVGIYLLCNAEHEGFGALDCKLLNREVLNWFVSNRPEAKLEESKTNCERLSYPGAFHIDLPFYYYDGETNTCKLASQNDEWLESDPKAFQDWFDKSASGFANNKLAQLRRVIKYFKVWTLLKGVDDGISIPSIALTVLVVQNYRFCDHDDDSFAYTAIEVSRYILENRYLDNPAQSGDLFRFSDDEYEVVRQKANALKNSCEYIIKSEDSFEQYILWGATFEHMFPPFAERREEVSEKTNLPAITTPPTVRVRNLDKFGKVRSNKITEEVKVFRNDSLYFSIENSKDYSSSAEVRWIVRNQNNEAKRLNDLGHISNQSVDEECYEECSYSGKHYMECLILEGSEIKGVEAIKVTIVGFPRPERNPPKKKYYRGK